MFAFAAGAHPLISYTVHLFLVSHVAYSRLSTPLISFYSVRSRLVFRHTSTVYLVFTFRLNWYLVSCCMLNHYFAVSRFYWPCIVHFKPLV